MPRARSPSSPRAADNSSRVSRSSSPTCGPPDTACDLVSENFRLHTQTDFHTLNLNENLPASFRQRFNAILALEIVEHLENPRHLVRQCFAALKPGGMLVVSTPNIASPLSLALFLRSGDFRWFTANEYDNDGHITPVSPNLLRQAMAEAGFTQIKSEFIAPPRMPGLHWWRMRALAHALRLAAGRQLPAGDILICTAVRP